MGLGANATDPDAVQVHGTNPQVSFSASVTRQYVCEQFLIEKITRQKIQGDAYWKEFCFALTAETIVDRAMELDHIGGVYGGNMKPTAFIQLILKLLQIQPEKEIIVEFIKNEDFKYVRALGAFYMRMVGKPLDVYQYLEPLLNDYRKLRVITGGEEASHAKRDTRFPERMAWAGYKVTYMDEFIDQLLTEDLVCDIALPTLPKRLNMEDLGQLQPRVSALEDEFNSDGEDADDQLPNAAALPPPSQPPPKDEPPAQAAGNRDRDRDAERGRAPAESPKRRSRSKSPPRQARSPVDDRRDSRSRSRSVDKDRYRDRDRDYRDYRDRDRDTDRRDRYRDRRSRERRRRSASRSRSRPRVSRNSHKRRRSSSPSRSRSRSPPRRAAERRRRSRSHSRSASLDRRRRQRSESRGRSRDRRSRSRSASPGRTSPSRKPARRSVSPRGRSRDRSPSRSPEPRKPEKRIKMKPLTKKDPGYADRHKGPSAKSGDSRAECERAGTGKSSEVDTEIDEANALRIKLGLKPLQGVDDWKNKR